MHTETDTGAMRLPLQTPAAIRSADAIHHALERFRAQPTTANKLAAVLALQAHLAAIEGSEETRM